MSVTLVLPVPPSTNNLYLTRGRSRVLSEQGRKFKKDAGIVALAAGLKPLEGRVKVTARVYRPRKAGDLDNYAKALLDSMKGIAWRDDKQVVEIHLYRYEDKKNPRSELEIEEATQ